jgi:hypothetical protein
MSRKGCGRKRLWSNLTSCHGSFMEGLKKTTKDSGFRSLGREFNSGPAECEALVLKGQNITLRMFEVLRWEQYWHQVV